MVGSNRVSGSVTCAVWIAFALSASCGEPSDAGGNDDAESGGKSGSAGSTGSGGAAPGGATGAGSGTGGNTATGGDAGEGGSSIGGGGRGGSGGDEGGEGGNGDTGGAGGNGGAGNGGAGKGGNAGVGGRPGGAGGAGAGGMGGRPGGAGGGGGKGAVGIPCSTDNCDPTSERCIVTTMGVASCVSGAALCPTGGGCVILECDGTEDCASGDACGYLLGESNSLLCVPANLGWPPPCSTTSDCPGNTQCVNVPGNVSGLGWQPRYCMG